MGSDRRGIAARENDTGLSAKIALTIAILVLSIRRDSVSLKCSTHPQTSILDQITHKKGERLLILGDLLFGQRISLKKRDGAVSHVSVQLWTSRGCGVDFR